MYNFCGLRLWLPASSYEVGACLLYDAVPLTSTSNNPATSTREGAGRKHPSAGFILETTGYEDIRAGSSEVP